MDQPQRANAAQLAARNIKAAKGGRRPGGRAGTPSRPNPLETGNQVPMFAPMPSGDAAAPQQNGGLFGGAVQAPSTFDFSAPGGSFIFSKDKTGMTNGSEISGTSDGNGHFEGDDRGGKRQFGGKPSAQQHNTLFKSFGSNPQNNAFGEQKPLQQSTNSLFSFGGSGPNAPSTNFNPPQASPAKSTFTFGATSQSTPASPGISFGSNASGGQPGNTSFNSNPPQSQGSIFSFGSTAAQPQQNTPFQFSSTSTPPANSSINFGNPPTTSAPTSTLFGNTQSSTSFSSSSLNFGAPTSTAQPMSNLFGTSAPPASPGINFGSTPTANAFPSLFSSTQTPQAPPTSNLFGATSQPPASSPGPFVGFNVSAPPAQKPLPNQEQASAPTNNLFGAQSSQPAPSRPLFGNIKPKSSQSELQSQPSISATTNLFSSPSKPETRNNLFGAPQVGTVGSTDNSSNATNDLFGNLNKPVDASVTQPKVNGFESNSFPQTSNLFGASKPLFSASPNSLNANKPSEGDNGKDAASEATKNDINKSSLFSFGNVSSPTKESQASKNIFSSSTSLDLPSTANQPPPSGMFPPLSQSTTNQTLQTNNLSQSGVSKMPPHAMNDEADSDAMRKFSVILQLPESELEQDRVLTPEVLAIIQDPQKKKQYFAACRLKALNETMAKMFQDINPLRDPHVTLNYYMDERVKILRAAGLYEGIGHKRKDREDDSETTTKPQKRPNQLLKSMAQSKSGQIPAESQAESSKSVSLFGATNPGLPQSNGAPFTNGTAQAGSSQASNPLGGSPIKNSFNSAPTNSPAKNAFNPLPASSPVKKNTPNTPFTPSTPSSPSNNAIDSFRNSGATAPIPVPSSSKGKRKAEDELTQNTEQVNPLRAIKTPKLNSSFSTSDDKTSSEGSTTSALFKGILNSPSKSNGSPEKKTQDEKPHFNPFGKLPVPKSPTKPQAESGAGIQSPFASAAQTPSQPNLFSIKGAATASQPSIFAPKNTPSNSQQNMFATNNASASTKPLPPSTSLSSTEGNLFAPKPQSTTATPSVITPANPFQLKATSTAANGADENGKTTNKPPTFGSISGLSAMEQFRQKAEQDAKAKDLKEMEKDKDNEWESDEETESDYEKKWWSRRAEEKKQKQKEAEELKNAGPKFTFKPSQDTSSSASKGNAASTSLFAQYTSGQGSSISAGNSLNGSRKSSPGPIGSATGSVLDGHGASQPVKNIFGHLSDTGSGQDDQDGESDADDEDDSENKDPNYYPSAENDSGPGTPVEETGAGIASAKKSNLFGLSNGTSFSPTPTSGHSTPGRSLFDRIGTKPVAESKEDGEQKSSSTTLTGGLFDRISKDSNGNPLRHISSEEKENTQPSSTNVFKPPFSGSLFSKSSPSPSDQTWKQDSPIKFGNLSATEGKDAAPTVSFTAATPTKAPTSLFGTTGSSSENTTTPFGGKPGVASPFSGLLGSNGTSNKAPTSSGVGFAFGAVQSTTSSLFPSTAGSAATSRGTSPGGTTDGASDADADPDTEHHEQINLTAGGPGEEDEEVVHEVRAKALVYDTTENKWQTKGLGPLRVLKHKETGVARVLLRGDPSGKIILNKGILGNITYSAEAKTVKFLAAEGDGLETFILQVKTPEFAEKLAEALNENKVK